MSQGSWVYPSPSPSPSPDTTFEPSFRRAAWSPSVQKSLALGRARARKKLFGLLHGFPHAGQRLHHFVLFSTIIRIAAVYSWFQCTQEQRYIQQYRMPKQGHEARTRTLLCRYRTPTSGNADGVQYRSSVAVYRVACMHAVVAASRLAFSQTSNATRNRGNTSGHGRQM